MQRTPTPPRNHKNALERRLDALAALDDPNRPTLTLSQAALCLGISVSTACRAARDPQGELLDTFELVAGVRAIRVTRTRRFVVAKADVRAVLRGSPATGGSRVSVDDDALASL